MSHQNDYGVQKNTFVTLVNKLPVAENAKEHFLRYILDRKISSIEEILLAHAINPCSFGSLIAGRVSIEEWEKILFFVCQLLIPKRSSLDFGKCKLSSGSTAIDEILRGGFAPGHTYDVFGEAGTGKSTLAMQACVNITERGGSALYFAIEQFSSNRLIQLSEGVCSSHETGSQGPPNLENFILCHTHDWKNLFRRLDELESVIKMRRERQIPIKIIVFDSIAAVQCIEKDDVKTGKIVFDTYRELMRKIQKLATFLMSLCAKHHITLLFLNQVRASNEITVPALGTSWANAVPTRLLLTKTIKKLRCVRVVYSTYLPQKKREFFLDNNGFTP